MHPPADASPATVDPYPETPRHGFQGDRGSLAENISNACLDAGFSIPPDSGVGPSNVSVSGSNSIQLSLPEPDASNPETWWLWGAADNMHLPAANAVKLAEMLL